MSEELLFWFVTHMDPYEWGSGLSKSREAPHLDYIRLWLVYVVLFCVHVGFFCVYAGLFCVHVGLFCVYAGLFCVHVGLFCVYAGLFCVYVGLFCVYVGLLCGYIGVLRLCVGIVRATGSTRGSSPCTLITTEISCLCVCYICWCVACVCVTSVCVTSVCVTSVCVSMCVLHVCVSHMCVYNHRDFWPMCELHIKCMFSTCKSVNAGFRIEKFRCWGCKHPFHCVQTKSWCFRKIGLECVLMALCGANTNDSCGCVMTVWLSHDSKRVAPNYLSIALYCGEVGGWGRVPFSRI